ncbi:reticuline oxidase [Fusarium mundagurra]|uniref:Reticuline oxidase n=1 Tax=Fusarium mundagurra TaxID=1567541 RepID=A0A8H6D7Q7_9HYPO|nr:reticuline oxidase [Fusarium mundagurra]
MPPADKSLKPNGKPSDDETAIETAKKKYQKLKSKFNLGRIFPNLILPAVIGAAVWARQPADNQFTAPPAALRTCLDSVCAGAADCVRYPASGENREYFQWASPFNLGRVVFPAAVVRPNTDEQLSGFVRCAAETNVKVQARSGGHSYANYGAGGYNGSLSIDMINYRYVTLDKTTWLTTIGAGSLLGDIDTLLEQEKGNRGFPHGVCPGVGIGGHATIGGLGPSSRMWGATLDHVVEAKVVTANGTLVTTSQTEYPDLFFAIRGAAAGFGIVTQFVIQTVEKPKTTLHFTHRTPYNPKLDHRIGTEFTLDPSGSKITATWFGTRQDFDKSGIAERLGLKLTPVESSWVNTKRWQAENAKLILSDIPTEFFSRSLGFTAKDTIEFNATKALVESIETNKGERGLNWFCIFDATGGKVAEPPMDSTAYAHRDKVMFYQSYLYNIWAPMKETKKVLLNTIHKTILDGLPAGPRTTYPGYIDPLLEYPQEAYWEQNLPRLEAIKAEWDPEDVFHNPQSVRPAKLKS